MRRVATVLMLALTGSAAFLLEAQEPRAGLIGEYFNIGEELDDFPDLPPAKRPVLRRIDRQLDWRATAGKFAESDLVDHFYVRWTGSIRIPRDGTYTLYLYSDDGSRLFIGDRMVVDNGGLHDLEERSGTIELKAGLHPIRIELIENEGRVAIRAFWEAEGLDKEIIPASALVHSKDKDLDRE